MDLKHECLTTYNIWCQEPPFDLLESKLSLPNSALARIAVAGQLDFLGFAVLVSMVTY